MASKSTILGRGLLATLAGMMFGGKRDIYNVMGYKKVLQPADLIEKYRRQDITGRIVDMPVEEMWSRPPQLKDLHGVKKKWDDFAAKTMLWQRIIQADRLCAFGPFSVLWLGLPGDPPLPASQITSLDNIAYIQAYGGDNVAVTKYEDDTSNPRYGQPTLYSVRLGPREQVRSVNVHWSRLIHIVDRPLQGLIFGEPRLATIFNNLDDLLKVCGGSAETYWLTANRGLQVDVDKDMQFTTEDANALAEEVEEYQHQLRRTLRTRGVKVNSLGSDVADPAGVFSVLISILAGTTNIPQRILMGSEAGQLASEQDRANWAEYMERRSKVFGEPYVLRPIMERLEFLGYLPKDSTIKANLGTEETMFEWPEFFHMSPLEDSNRLNSVARSVTNLSRRAQFGDPVVSDQEARVMLSLPPDKKTGDTFPEAPPPPTPFGGGGSGTGGKGSGKSATTEQTSAVTK